MVIIQLIDDEGIGTLVTEIGPAKEKKLLPALPVLPPPYAEPQVVPVIPTVPRIRRN